MRTGRAPFASNSWLYSDDKELEVDVNESQCEIPWFRRHSATNIRFEKRGGKGNVLDQKFEDIGKDLTLAFSRFGWHRKTKAKEDFYFNGEIVRSVR